MDTLEFTTSGRRWHVDLSSPLDLAIPLEFDGPQPRFFSSEPARAVPLRTDGFTGDVRSGASCNCGIYTLAPHCHGTHTECVGHITGDRKYLTDMTPVVPALAVLVTVTPGPLGSSREDGPELCDPADSVITREDLAVAVSRWVLDPWTALVVRTLPNDPARCHRRYGGPAPAPYFTPDAMQWIVARDVTSLVVDVPSLDRAEDGGALAAHRIYWGLPRGVREAGQARRGRALVTELAYVTVTVADGLYLLDLQVPAFAADAAPSRPVLYSVVEAAGS